MLGPQLQVALGQLLVRLAGLVPWGQRGRGAPERSARRAGDARACRRGAGACGARGFCAQGARLRRTAQQAAQAALATAALSAAACARQPAAPGPPSRSARAAAACRAAQPHGSLPRPVACRGRVHILASLNELAAFSSSSTASSYCALARGARQRRRAARHDACAWQTRLVAEEGHPFQLLVGLGHEVHALGRRVRHDGARRSAPL